MTKEIALTKLQQLSRPLMQYCLRHGVKLGELVDVVKRCYVEVAEEILASSEEAVSTSRLSIMTGVHRTDVATIRSERDFAPKPRQTASEVIGRWRYDKRFSSKPGQPRALEVEGKQSEFAQLVKSVSLSLSPYTVLFELERLEVVKRTRDGKVKLLSRVFVPKGDPGAILDMLAEDAEDLYLAVDDNAFSRNEDNTPHLHVKTEYSNVPKEYIGEIKGWFLKQGSAFHERARNFLSRFDKDLSPKVKGSDICRVAVTSYSYIGEPVSNKDKHRSKSDESSEES